MNMSNEAETPLTTVAAGLSLFGRLQRAGELGEVVLSC